MSDEKKGSDPLDTFIKSQTNPDDSPTLELKAQALFALVTVSASGGEPVPYPDIKGKDKDKLGEVPWHILATVRRCKAYAKANPKKVDEYDELDAGKICAEMAGLGGNAGSAASGSVTPIHRGATGELTREQRLAGAGRAASAAPGA